MNKIEHTILNHNEMKKLPDSVELMSGAWFEVPQSDNGILLIIDAKEGGDITVTAGDSVLAGADHVAYACTGMNVIALESGRYLHTKGDNKGKILVRAAGEAYGWVVELK